MDPPPPSSSSSSASASSSSSTIVTISNEDFLLFHQMDRDLYSILVNNLSRDPLESMQLLSFWLWLERLGFRSVVKNTMALPVILINEVADESTIFLSYLVNINNNTSLIPPLSPTSESIEIPLLQSIVKEEISLNLLLENRALVIQGIESTKQDICLKALSDIMQEAMMRGMAERMVEHSNLLLGSFGPEILQFGSVGGSGIAGAIVPQQFNNGGGFVAPDDRTLFVTFSKGYRVEEWEVRNFLTMAYGDCIENFKFQETANNEQPLFARIVFHNVNIIGMILGGASKVKFTINGKHVWARKFVPKRGNSGRMIHGDAYGFANAGFGM